MKKREQKSSGYLQFASKMKAKRNIQRQITSNRSPFLKDRQVWMGRPCELNCGAVKLAIARYTSMVPTKSTHAIDYSKRVIILDELCQEARGMFWKKKNENSYEMVVHIMGDNPFYWRGKDIIFFWNFIRGKDLV